MINEKDEWGNLDLPGFSHEQLMDPNLNRKLAAKQNAKNPVWRKNNIDAITKPDVVKRKSNATKKQWKNGSKKSAIPKIKNSLKKLWNDENYRETQKKSRYEQYNVPEKTANFESPIKGTHKKTGETIIFYGAKQMKNYGFIPANIYACVNGKRNSAHGYTWKRIYKKEKTGEQ